jgi:DNA-binding transcriptional regulator YiaG
MKQKSPAELVKAIRESMQLTQERFAAHFGVTVATVNRWENGRAVPQPLASSCCMGRVFALAWAGRVSLSGRIVT